MSDWLLLYSELASSCVWTGIHILAASANSSFIGFWIMDIQSWVTQLFLTYNLDVLIKIVLYFYSISFRVPAFCFATFSWFCVSRRKPVTGVWSKSLVSFAD